MNSHEEATQWQPANPPLMTLFLPLDHAVLLIHVLLHSISLESIALVIIVGSTKFVAMF